MFKDREDAGKRLADKLGHLQGKDVVVLAIPRGGVVIGKILSQELACPLEVLVVKKIGAPGNPELAVGAMGPGGEVAWNENIIKELGIDKESLGPELKIVESKLQKYRENFKYRKLDLKSKTVIITDDGIATGATIETALHFIWGKLPKKIVLAIPVAPPEVVEKLKSLVNELIVLETPEYFGAVGQFYEEFPQVEDEDVIKLLQDAIHPDKSE